MVGMIDVLISFFWEQILCLLVSFQKTRMDEEVLKLLQFLHLVFLKIDTRTLHLFRKCKVQNVESPLIKSFATFDQQFKSQQILTPEPLESENIWLFIFQQMITKDIFLCLWTNSIK